MPPYRGIRAGFRADLGIRVRSRWEANYCRILNWRVAQGELRKWEYESKTFVFSGVTRGCVCYTPDFCLTYADGRTEYVEVKGRELSRDRTKWKRMAKFYPNVKLTVIGEAEYFRLTQQFWALEHWEH